MNKAFTKESDDDLPVVPLAAGFPPIALGFSNRITATGFKRFQQEIELLSSLGTLTPETQGRLALLRDRAATWEVNGPALGGVLESGQDNFGYIVQVCDQDGKGRSYQIVGIDETSPSSGRISWLSPMGQALLRVQVGDEVKVQTPRGKITLEVTLLSE